MHGGSGPILQQETWSSNGHYSRRVFSWRGHLSHRSRENALQSQAGIRLDHSNYGLPYACDPFHLLSHDQARLPPRKDKFFLLSAFKEPPYVLLIASTFLMLFGVFIPIFYLPTYAVYYGMSSELASCLIAILNAASFFGRLIPGALADKFGRFNMFFVVGLSTGILIICWQRITANATIVVFAALYGFCSGAVVSLTTVCLATIPKDPRNIGTYMGMGMFVVSFAALAGPPSNGALVSNYNSYDQTATMSGILVMARGFLIMMVKYFIGREEPGKGIFSKT